MAAEPFDGCQVVSRLRSGPITDLFDAIQKPLGRRVLVKALNSSILPSSPFAATLEREARVLSALDHPGVVRVLDFVRRDDRMWLVLEYVDGWDLATVERELAPEEEPPAPPPPLSVALGQTSREEPPASAARGRIPWPAATAIACQIARALEHAHEREVIHRNLEPDNVLITRRGEVKLTGFSVAEDSGPASVPEAIDASGKTSLGYMSPEQILGELPDPRSDFFSLGVVLYEMLSGQHPFGAPSDPNTAQRVRHDSPPLLSRLEPSVPGSLERIVVRCLEKMGSDRFQNAHELRHALELVLSENDVKSPQAAVVSTLADAGLVEGGAERPSRSRVAVRERPHGLPLRGLFVGLGLIVGGGAVIQGIASHSSSEGPLETRPLELLPESAGSLRVVATPWAHVFVDGQQVATTPFATPIPLRPGTHYVRLDHPAAESEHRTLHLAPGEAIFLDVSMNVRRARDEESAEEPQEPEDDSP